MIRKSTFTRLKKACLQARLPQLIGLVEVLEAAALLLARERLPALTDQFLVFFRHGREFVRGQHHQAGYYQKWLARREPRDLARARREARRLSYNPVLAICMAAGGTADFHLQASLQSLRRQYYPHWQLLLFGVASLPPESHSRIRSLFQPTEARVHFLAHQDQATLNQTLATLSADFVIFPASGDLLSPAALFEVANLLNAHPEADIIYPDEDLLDVSGKRFAPFFKPGWSPDLALAFPYTGPLTVFRSSLVQALGEVKTALGPLLHYELLLNSMTRTPKPAIFHIPKILYHRQANETATAPEAAPALNASLQQIVQGYLQRTSQTGTILPGDYQGTLRLRRDLHEPAGVSIIIPFQDRVALLAQCLASIFQKTDYPTLEIILINNQSREEATFGYLAQLADQPRIRLLDYPQPFNYAAMNNRAAAQAAHPYLLFLNSDTEVISPSWLRAMLEQLQQEEVGAVGAKLLYPDHTIQHGGLALGGGGRLCGDYFRGLPADTRAGHGLAQVIRNCSAVTGACLLTKKSLFLAVGGFDEVNLPICYNDLDYCLKLRQLGCLIVWTPYALLYHHESASRGKELNVAELRRLCREQAFFEKKWWPVVENDPYYNPNLSRLFDGYAY